MTAPQKCDACDGTGSTPGAQWLAAIVELLMVAGGEAGQPLHPRSLLCDLPLPHPSKPPGADLAALTTALAGRPPRPPIGHDALDRYVACRTIAAAAGMPEAWGVCSVCAGEGERAAR